MCPNFVFKADGQKISTQQKMIKQCAFERRLRKMTSKPKTHKILYYHSNGKLHEETYEKVFFLKVCEHRPGSLRGHGELHQAKQCHRDL